MTLVFTLCSNNYLAQAIALGNSLLKHNPNYVFKIGLVDKKNAQIDYSVIPFEIIEVENIGIIAFKEMFERYDITELNTAVKPYYFKYFFKTEKNIGNFIYFDPDILLYKPLIELEKELQINDIVIIPHFTTPISDDKFPSENNILNAGLYNLGFIALRRTEESQKLIDWWAERLKLKAYIDFTNGMFTDQLWINFTPLFFKNVSVFKHPGYNMAYWNLHERFLNDTCEVVKENISSPLVFFHFSGYDPLKPEILSKYQNRFTFETRKDLDDLFKEYSTCLFKNNLIEFQKIISYYVIQKQKLDLDKHLAVEKEKSIYKRIIRRLILRIVALFKIDIDYFTH